MTLLAFMPGQVELKGQRVACKYSYSRWNKSSNPILRYLNFSHQLHSISIAIHSGRKTQGGTIYKDRNRGVPINCNCKVF